VSQTELESRESVLNVLIVEDDVNLRAALAALASREGAVPREAGTLEEARKRLAETPLDAVLVDLTLPDGSGLSLLGAPEALGTPEYIVVTGDGTAESAVQALKRGAIDYLTKPVDRARLRSVLANVQRTRVLKHEAVDLRHQLREFGRFGRLIGRSAGMQRVYDLIERVAPTDAGVFVTGESGTGKELVAETIHLLSRRRSHSFVAVNCGALAPSLIESEFFGHEKGSFTGADRRRVGYFERADGGTLFLDEITEMPQELQVKLLRVLEEEAVTRVGATDLTPVDVRIVAASNRDPHDAVAKGQLREDLLYRLNIFPIDLPPLRAREDDAVLLAEHFLDRVNTREGSRKRFTPRALARLRALSWPGNVRELENAVERAAILADEAIDAEALPRPHPGEAIAEDAALHVRVGTPLEDIERRMILATLESLDGNKRRTAELLGISLKTLYNRLSVYQAMERRRTTDGAVDDGRAAHRPTGFSIP
jgi:two-component system, NtrC family, response regulator AtoC